MSHLRDLQKLRNTRNIDFYSARNSNPEMPQILHINFDKFLHGDSQGNDNYNKFLQSKQLHPKTRQKKNHKRGISIGYNTTQRKQRDINVSPGLSIYNFSMKMSQRKSNPLTSRRERVGQVVQLEQLHMQKKQKQLKVPISKNLFKVLYPVGKGGFGKVWKVQNKKTHQIYAMKQMYKAKIIQKKSINSVMNQRALLAKVRHPFLVNMSYAFQDRENLYLVMDYLDGGDLRYHIGKKRNFTQKQTKFFIANLLIGLQYLHNNKIIHRDIKPENLVLDSQGYVRITDLGVSRQHRDDNHQDTSGTPGYMAPQIMCRQNHSYVADIFAVGVIGYEFMLGRRPYNGRNRKEIRQQILSKQVSIRLDELPYKWSPDAVDLINKMLIRNPQQRIGTGGIFEIKQHKWFADIDWVKMSMKKIKAPYIPLSIEEDYDEYKEQISEDTIEQNAEQNLLMLRDKEVQSLFDGYEYIKPMVVDKKRSTSYTTNHTDPEHYPLPSQKSRM